MTSFNENPSSLIDALEILRKKGYTEDFNIDKDCIQCSRISLRLSHEDFQVDGFYRFEGMTNPEDESIIYAITSLTDGTKGVLVDGYGISSDVSTEILNKLIR